MRRLTTAQLATAIWTALVIIFTALTAEGSTRIYGTVVFTNTPAQSNTVVLNGDSRQWLTAIVYATNQITATNTIGGNVTNLYQHAVLYPFTNGVDVVSSSLTSTSTVFAAQKNQPLTISFSGTYAYVVYRTNIVNDAEGVAMPFTIEGPTSRTNIASGLVNAIDGNARSAFTETNKALENYVSKAQAQTVSNKTFEASTFHGGSVSGVTNLTGTNVTLSTGSVSYVTLTYSVFHGSISNLSNGVIYSTTIDGGRLTNVAGLAGAIHQIIGGVWSNGTLTAPVMHGPVLSNAVIIGNTTVTGSSVNLIGSGVNNFISLTATSTIAAAGPIWIMARENGITNAVDAGDVLGVLVFNGWGTTAQKVGARIRAIPVETFTDSTAGTVLLLETTPSGATQPVGRLHIGSDGSVTFSNNVQVVGNLVAPTLTGTNRQSGVPVMALQTITSAAAGNNTISALTAGVRITGTPGAGWTLASLSGTGIDGQCFEVYNDTGYVMTIGNESGFDGTAANRIRTMTGADYVSGTNAVATFRYDGLRSRWIMRTVHP